MKTTERDKKKVADNIRHSRLIDASRRMARIVKHVDPAPKKIAERGEYEKNLAKWLKFFGGEAFDSEWSEDHLRVIGKVQKAITEGGMFALAMPRGHGKTTVLKWTALYVMLTGKRKYVCLIAATSEMSEAIIEFCRQQVTENDRLHEYYPHVTAYARATDGKAIRAKFQLRGDGKPSGITWTTARLVFADVCDAQGKPYESNGAIVEGHGMTGAIRGKWRDSRTGKVLRPDFVILDDPQTRESAESESQTLSRERIITGDVMGLAGPKKKIAAVMPCTVIRKGDLADKFLDHKVHPEWQGETCQLVKKWPDAQEGLWVEYANMYRENTSEGRGFDLATQFYAENRAAMDAGAVVSWAQRVRDGEISALQTAENLLIEAGAQFWAEYQNAPLAREYELYDLTPYMVAHRVNGLPRYHVLPDVKIVVAFADINYIGMWWAMIGLTNNYTGYILDYGKHPEGKILVPRNATEADKRRRVAEGCVSWLEKMSSVKLERNGIVLPLRAVGIDRGFLPEVVHSIVNVSRHPFSVVPVRGFAGAYYRPNSKGLIGKPGHNVHFSESPNGQFLASNTDYFKEVVQRGFLASPGVPGSLSIYGKHAEKHGEFANQICAETLIDKAEGNSGTFWKWKLKPGATNDGLDAVTGCYSLLSWFMGVPQVEGVTTTRRVIRRTQLRKPKVMIQE